MGKLGSLSREHISKEASASFLLLTSCKLSCPGLSINITFTHKPLDFYLDLWYYIRVEREGAKQNEAH